MADIGEIVRDIERTKRFHRNHHAAVCAKHMPAILDALKQSRHVAQAACNETLLEDTRGFQIHPKGPLRDAQMTRRLACAGYLRLTDDAPSHPDPLVAEVERRGKA